MLLKVDKTSKFVGNHNEYVTIYKDEGVVAQALELLDLGILWKYPESNWCYTGVGIPVCLITRSYVTIRADYVIRGR